MSTSPIVITPSTSVVLINTADFSGNPVVLLPNLTSAPGVIGRIITIRDNDGGSVVPAKSIYISTTGGARFQSELSSITLSTIRITQPYGFITLTPRLTDGSGNTNYGLMNVYAFPDASPAAYVNTLNANFSYLSTLSTVNLAVSQNTFIQGNLTVNGTINYANPGTAALGVGTLNANTISAATILNRTFNGVNINASTINTSTFVVRDSGSILLPNASTWSNASAFAGTADPNSLNLGTPAAGAGAQIGLSSNFFGIRAFTKDSSATTYSTTVVMRDRNVAINPASITGIGVDGNPYSDYRLFVTGSTRLSNQGLNNNTVLLKQAGAAGCNFEVNEFGGTLGTFRMDTSSNITEGFFGAGLFANQYKWMSASKAGSIQFFTGTSPTADTSARVTIDTAGRVGIGKTAAAGYALDISGGNARITQTGTSATLDFSATGGTFSIIRQTGTNGNVDILNNGTGLLSFGTNAGPGKFVIDSNGLVGVGTVSPTFNLDVSGAGAFGGSATNRFLATSNEAKWRSDGTAHWSIFNSNSQLQIRNTSANVALGTPGIGVVFVDTTGGVGIGRSPTAGYVLDVSGLGRIINSGSGSAGLDFNAGGGILAVGRSTGTNGNADIINYGTGVIGFGTNGTSGRMVINSSGQVGLNTGSPNALLNLREGTGLGDTSGNPLLCLQGGDFGTGRGNFWMDGVGLGQKIYIQAYVGGASITTNPGSILLNPFGGAIGIGTEFPAATLDVSGTARITSNLTVNGSFNITPAGSIMIWSTNTAPSGWLLCDGTSYTTTAQATLFAVIAYTYGGSGANFNVPNMKQRVPVGRDTIDASFNTIGYTSGEKTHILTEAEIPSHSHDYKFPTSQTAQGGGGDTVAEDNFSLALTKTSVATGGGGAHNNMQPYMVLNYIIKT